MINQKQIADTLGLSIITVSRALRNHPDLSEETKARVIQKAREMGYTKFAPAAPAAGQHGRVAILAYEPHGDGPNLFRSDVQRTIFASLQRECQQHGVETVVEFPEPAQVPLSVKNNTVTAAFIFGRYTAPDVALLQQLPVLAVSSFIADKTLSRIAADNVGGMGEITTHLIQRGHRKILFLGGKDDFTELHRERADGYAAVMCRHGLTPTVRFITDQELPEVLGALGDHSAIACSNDWLASNVASHLAEQAGRHKSRITITGFDNLSCTVPYGITTYAPDWVRMGQLAADLMLFNSKNLGDGLHVTVPGKLIVRD